MAPCSDPWGLDQEDVAVLGCERELRLGVCFWFRLFNVAPETTARFSYIDDRSRSLSPLGSSTGRTTCATRPHRTAWTGRDVPQPLSGGSSGRRRRPGRRRRTQVRSLATVRPRGRRRVRRPGRRWRGACRTGGAPGEGQLHLGPTVLEVDRERHHGQRALLGLAHPLVDLASVHEQLPTPVRVVGPNPLAWA